MDAFASPGPMRSATARALVGLGISSTFPSGNRISTIPCPASTAIPRLHHRALERALTSFGMPSCANNKKRPAPLRRDRERSYRHDLRSAAQRDPPDPWPGPRRRRQSIARHA
jgi:hypothetical protein